MKMQILCLFPMKSCWKGTELKLKCYFVDVNECLLNTHECHMNATCTNLNGTYDCNCTEGFHGSGFNCSGGWTIAY